DTRPGDSSSNVVSISPNSGISYTSTSSGNCASKFSITSVPSAPVVSGSTGVILTSVAELALSEQAESGKAAAIGSVISVASFVATLRWPQIIMGPLKLGDVW